MAGQRSTPLVDAAFRNDIEAVRELLDNGADVNERDDFNSTALHYAVTMRNHEMIELLLAHGAEVSVKDNAGEDAIYIAGDNGDLHLVETLKRIMREQTTRKAQESTPRRELHELLEAVNDRATFFEFVRALIDDRENSVRQEQESPTPHAGLVPEGNGWCNFTIESYLEAALAWAESTDMGRTQGLGDVPSWKQFAMFLYCGKIYE